MLKPRWIVLRPTSLGRGGRLRFKKLLETIKMQSDALRRYGWDARCESGFESFWKEGLEPGRVLEENRQGFRVYAQHGEIRAEVSGRFRFKADARESFPAVGDWVALRRLPAEDRAIIEAVLPRKASSFEKLLASRLKHKWSAPTWTGCL